jgi:hypothetical protein
MLRRYCGCIGWDDSVAWRCSFPLAVFLLWLVSTAFLTLSAQFSPNSVIELKPALEQLDAASGWTDERMVQYLEPLAAPPVYTHPQQPDPKASKGFMERHLQSMGCVAYVRAHYGKKNLAINSGGHHLMIYRWDDATMLDARWNKLRQHAPFKQDDVPGVGEASCWVHHGLFYALAFRRMGYLIQVECGRNDPVYGLVELADSVDALIKANAEKVDALP